MIKSSRRPLVVQHSRLRMGFAIADAGSRGPALVLAATLLLGVGCGGSQGESGSTHDAGSSGDAGAIGGDGSARGTTNDGGPGGTANDGGGQNSPGDAGAAAQACGAAFDALSSNACSAVGSLSPSDLARDRQRYVTACEGELALPGLTLTPSKLQACAAAAAASTSCAADIGQCTFSPGTLDGGAACADDLQCASSSCMASTDPDGGFSACGACAAAIGVGQSCAGQEGQCAANAACATAGAAAGTCQTIVQGQAGAACDGVVNQCASGLYCDLQTGMCAALKAGGAACAPDVDQCVAPFVCSQATSQCQNPATSGGACASDSDCAASLGCSIASETCGAIHWAGSGQACGDLTRCVAGDCPLALGDGGAVTCPTVIADGQPCDLSDATSTCDVYAACVGGTCQLFDTKACN